ncbi:MAG: hypothetical protein WBZ16_09470 [Pseudolabrys sp.]
MTDFFSTNTFDLAVYVCLFVAVVMGFMTGCDDFRLHLRNWNCSGGNAEGHLSPRELSENSNAADLDHIHCNFYSGVVL